MNPGMLIHTASVERQNLTPVAGHVPGTWSQVIAEVRCLVETLKGHSKDSMFGRISGAAYRLSWGAEDIRNGDRVTWNSKAWIIDDVAYDNAIPWMPYHTAILKEQQ